MGRYRRDDDDYEDEYDEDDEDRDIVRRGPTRHSGPGIASFMVAIAAGVILGLSLVVGVAVEASRPGALGPESPGAIMIGIIICFGLFMTLVGVGLGIAGISQKNRRNVFAILGLVVNGLILLGGGCLVLLGIAASGPH